MKRSRHLGKLLDNKLWIEKTPDRLNELIKNLDECKIVVRIPEYINEDKIVGMEDEKTMESDVIHEPGPIEAYFFYRVDDKERIKKNNEFIDKMLGNYEEDSKF